MTDLRKFNRGRPKVGLPAVTRLSESELEVAAALGDGKVAAGLRRAVQLVVVLGLPGAKRILDVQEELPPARIAKAKQQAKQVRIEKKTAMDKS